MVNEFQILVWRFKTGLVNVNTCSSGGAAVHRGGTQRARHAWQ